jgi:hypothetical protein
MKLKAVGGVDRPWLAGQTSIGVALNSAWKWHVRSETTTRAPPHRIWPRFGCDWRII